MLSFSAFTAPEVMEHFRQEEFLQRLHTDLPPQAAFDCSVASTLEFAWTRMTNRGVSYCVAEIEAIRKLSPNYLAVPTEVLFSKLDDSARPMRNYVLPTAVALVVIPPVLVLLLAYLIAWIVAGFWSARDMDATKSGKL